MGFENPLNPSYYPSNGASDLPTYFCQRSLRATPKVKHESPQTIKVCPIENNTNLNSIFCLIKSSKIALTFLPAFYLNIWLMTKPKNFEKIAILKI